MLLKLSFFIILLLCYKIFKIRIPIAIYCMVAEYPYRELFDGTWVDTVIETTLLVEVILYYFERKKADIKIDYAIQTFLFIVSLFVITIIYSLWNGNIMFMAKNTDTRFYIGTYLLIILIANECVTIERIWDLCTVFHVNSYIASFFGMYYWLTGASTSLYAFTNKNIFGIYIFIGLFCLMIKKRIIPEKITNKSYVIQLVFLSVLIFFNGSSAALISLVVMFLFLFIKKIQLQSSYFYKISLAGIIVVAIILMWLTINNRVLDSVIIRTILSRKGYYDLTRVYIWQQAWEQFVNHWFIGIGADQFRSDFWGYHFATHNDYLSLLVNYGVCGFTAFIIYSASLYKTVFKLKQTEIRSVLFAAYIGLYLYIVTHNFINYICFWILGQIGFNISKLIEQNVEECIGLYTRRDYESEIQG